MKNDPIISKEDVVDVVREALMSKVGKVLDGYSSPLDKIICSTIAEHEEELSAIIRQALALTLKDKQFVANVNTEFKHKIAKVLVGKMEGAVEKATEKLRANPTLRARLIVAIENIINE